MNSLTTSRDAGSFHGKVKLADLNLDFFEDRELAEDLADDCLQLFKTTESDFDSVRSQRWYKRLWSTISGGNTRKLAQGCASLAQAQQLLLKVLQTHAQTNARSNALMMFIARGLRHLEGQQNRVVAHIIHMADRIELLEKEVQLHRRQLDADPSNELTWNQEHKLLLYKLLVICAHIDGELEEEEERLLEHKLGELELRDEYLSEALEFNADPHSIDEELEEIDSYKKRLVIYKHAMGMFYADGRIEPQERSGMRHLAGVLNIKKRDLDAINNAFASLHNEFTTDQLLALMSKRKQRVAEEPSRSDFVAIDDKRTEMQESEERSRRDIENAVAQLREVGKQWIEMSADVAAFLVVQPVIARFEAYGELEAYTIEQLVAAMSAEAILSEINGHLSEMQQSIGGGIEEVARYALLPPETGDIFASKWQACIQDHGNWENALAELGRAGVDILEAKPSDVMQFVKGGALGFAGAALLGPIGLLGGAAIAYLDGHSAEKKQQSAALRWDAAITCFAEATDRWQSNAHGHMTELFAEIMRLAERAIVEQGTRDFSETVLGGLRDDIEEIRQLTSGEEQGRIEGDGEGVMCPSCMKEYAPGTTYCWTCSVAL